ncbi:hypothetical protein V1478_015278 [Vespula squamosa]|uniref:Uncharacterized protein n=1 Tax=Vespula squamosa TaxID=30214 RepID=A0ABD2A777_VESSQ
MLQLGKRSRNEEAAGASLRTTLCCRRVIERHSECISTGGQGAGRRINCSSAIMKGFPVMKPPLLLASRSMFVFYVSCFPLANPTERTSWNEHETGRELLNVLMIVLFQRTIVNNFTIQQRSTAQTMNNFPLTNSRLEPRWWLLRRIDAK